MSMVPKNDSPHARQDCSRAGQLRDRIEAGAGVLVVEAMKMQNEIKSPKKGTIQKILVSKAPR